VALRWSSLPKSKQSNGYLRTPCRHNTQSWDYSILKAPWWKNSALESSHNNIHPVSTRQQLLPHKISLPALNLPSPLIHQLSATIKRPSTKNFLHKPSFDSKREPSVNNYSLAKPVPLRGSNSVSSYTKKHYAVISSLILRISSIKDLRRSPTTQTSPSHSKTPPAQRSQPSQKATAS
jgi:hypothetical protein